MTMLSIILVLASYLVLKVAFTAINESGGKLQFSRFVQRVSIFVCTIAVTTVTTF